MAHPTDYIGRETRITAKGRTLILSRFNRRLWRDFMLWAEKVLPNPLDILKDRLASFPPDIQKELANKAYDAARLAKSVTSPEVQALIESPEGTSQIITMLLREKQPELSDDDAWQFFEDAVQEHGIEKVHALIAEASGTVPADATAKKKTSR